jgi:hypothetical protein
MGFEEDARASEEFIKNELEDADLKAQLDRGDIHVGTLLGVQQVRVLREISKTLREICSDITTLRKD